MKVGFFFYLLGTLSKVDYGRSLGKMANRWSYHYYWRIGIKEVSEALQLNASNTLEI
jgi:hypothetical protein